MKYIAHRANTNGPNQEEENSPKKIKEVLNSGYDVEIDLRLIDDKLFLGHDEGKYEIDFEFLNQPGLWIHCKNIEAFLYLREKENTFSSFLMVKRNFFWHQTDDVALTSKGFFFTFPGKKLTEKSISVMPEWSVDSTYFDKCYGVCSDYVEKIKNGEYTIEKISEKESKMIFEK